MIALLRRLAALGFRKGIGGGNRGWLAFGVLTWLIARAKEKDKDPPPQYREVLGPGEAMAVRILEPPR